MSDGIHLFSPASQALCTLPKASRDRRNSADCNLIASRIPKSSCATAYPLTPRISSGQSSLLSRSRFLNLVGLAEERNFRMAAKPGEMHVLHIVPSLFDVKDGVLGGAERYALELARFMAEQVSTRLVTFGEQNRLERIDNLDVRVIGQPWKVRGQASNPFS